MYNILVYTVWCKQNLDLYNFTRFYLWSTSLAMKCCEMHSAVLTYSFSSSFLWHFGVDINVYREFLIFILFFLSPLSPYCWRMLGSNLDCCEVHINWQAESPCCLPPGYILWIDIRLHFFNHSMLHIYLIHETCGSAFSAS